MPTEFRTSPFAPLAQHLAEHKVYPPLHTYIDEVKADHDDWGVFVNPSDPINDYRIGYIHFEFGDRYRLVATLKEVKDYPYNGETFCKTLPELIHASNESF